MGIVPARREAPQGGRSGAGGPIDIDRRGGRNECQKALALDPEYGAARVGLGQAETLLGRPEAALRHLDAAIELLPNQAAAHLARGRALEALGRPDEALAAYFRALEQDP